MQLKILNCVYHRNGIGGIGFYAVEFTYVEDDKERHAIGTVDTFDVDALRKGEPHDPGTRIIMLNAANEPIIEETMRGDYFHEELVKHIIEGRK